MLHAAAQALLPRRGQLVTISQPIPDLTGQILKTQPYSFAIGGNAEVYKAQWVENGSGRVAEVQIYFCARRSFVNIFFHPCR